jgi:hypothetical protein
MARIDPRVGAIAYLVGRSQQQAAKFIKEKAKQLPHAKIVNQVEDLPRRRGLSIVLLPGYDKRTVWREWVVLHLRRKHPLLARGMIKTTAQAQYRVIPYGDRWAVTESIHEHLTDAYQHAEELNARCNQQPLTLVHTRKEDNGNPRS